jgi:hypothetical protein
MWLVFLLGGLGVVVIMTNPLRMLHRQPIAALGNKALASLCFCLAGVVAAAQREQLSFPAAGLLMGFLLAMVGDIFLALEPVLAHPERDRGFAFLAGGLPFLLAHAVNLAVLWQAAPVPAGSWWLLPGVLLLPGVYALLWGTGLLRLGKAGGGLLVYAALLSALLTAAVSLAVFAPTPRRLAALALPAALLFIASDTSLFLATFGHEKLQPKIKAHFSFFVMLPYYLAQALMASVVLYL